MRRGSDTVRHATLLLALVLTACTLPPDRRHFMPGASAERGKAIIERVGCTSCHSIAGKLPNRPDMLAAYVRDAPAMVPGSGMPAMPLTQKESRDVAAYLYTLGS